MSFTRNLKLKLVPSLTADARYNLERLDKLASIFNVNEEETGTVRAAGNLVIQPQSAEVGGTGTGGIVSLGTQGQPLDSLRIYSSLADFGGTPVQSAAGLRAKGATYYASLEAAASGQTANLVFRLPANVGSSGQFLKTDGAGNLSWDTVAGGGGTSSTSAVWLAADGTTKVITHGWGTRKVLVQILDPDDSYKTIDVGDISRPTDNTVVITSTEAPATAWLVLLQEVN